MKKILKIMIYILIIFSIFETCSGQVLKLEYDGKIHEIEQEPITLYINKIEVKPSIVPVILEGRTLVPLRGVFESVGAEVKWDNTNKMAIIKYNDKTITLKINETAMYINEQKFDLDVPAKLINNSTMVPVRAITENLDFTVLYKQETNSVYIQEKPQTSDIKVQQTVATTVKNTITNKVETVDVSKEENGNVIVKINATEPISSYDKFHLDTGIGEYERIVVDISQSIMEIKEVDFEVAEDVLNNIRYSQRASDTDEISRVVLDLKDQIDYSIRMSDDEKSIIITLGEGQGITDEIKKLNSIEELNRLLEDNTLSLSKTSETTNIVINKLDTQNYKVTKNDEDKQIIIEITPANLSKSRYKVSINDKIVSSITTSMKESTGKIVIDLLKSAEYETVEENGKAIIKINKDKYLQSVRYDLENGMGIIRIDNADLASKVMFTEDLPNKKIIAKVSAKSTTLITGNIPINDNLLRSIYIELVDGYYEIQINYVNDIYYSTDVEKGDKTLITIIAQGQLLSPNKKGVKVVIDPGHGGDEPGAIRGETYEKTLNLDIASRLEKLLKNKGISVVMTRTADTTVELKERANIANKSGADLFVSIHINSYDNNSVSGTETLYYPSNEETDGISGKRIAELVQKELVAALGTNDRGIKSRPKLVVLNSTLIPAILAEIAFISNEEEKAQLERANFRQQAAEALYNGIVRAINEMD